MTPRTLIDAAEDVGMRDRLRQLEWVGSQIGLKTEAGIRRWLRRNGVKVRNRRVLESEFFRVWRGSPADAR